MDSSMLGGGDSQTTGAYFLNNNDTAASIATNTSKRRTNATKKVGRRKASLPKTSEDEPSVNEGSTVSGTSGPDIPPPSDQELFAMGWAKAMDPKSGAYYYFTLDRSKIVWDNPLVEKSVFSSSTTSSYR